MDYKLAAAIYGKPWLIEREAAMANLGLLEEMKAGKLKFKKPESSSTKKFFVSSEMIVAPTDRWAAKEHPGYEGKTVAVLPIMGPIMKEDFCGAYGTASLLQVVKQIIATESIKSLILVIDSPGGQVDGLEPLAEAIRNSKKETQAVIDGMCCSAAYRIACACDSIVATASTDLIGSIGTMIAFYDRTEALEAQGIILREYYATASTDKNKDMREARDGNGKLLIQNMLDPTNDIFLAAVREARGEKLNQEETLTGKVFLAGKALELGLIDRVESLDKAVTNHLQKHQTQKFLAVSNKPNAFQKLLALVGLASLSATENVQLQDEHLEKVESALTELETTKATLETANASLEAANAKVTELETAATASAEKITALESDKARLQAEVERLGALDGKKPTQTTGEQDPKETEAPEASAMGFQKDLYAKLD